MSHPHRDYFGHVIGQYRPTTGPEISNFLKAKALKIPAHERGYHTRDEIEEFLRQKGAL